MDIDEVHRGADEVPSNSIDDAVPRKKPDRKVLLIILSVWGGLALMIALNMR